ncbi:MAG: hypothetical protein ACI8V2_000138 [Candidatus Latescibacterota bacterium]|jgi:hypothetical protein
MNTHKIAVKFYMDKGQDIAPETWFKTFNKWISANAGPDVLIDVADYSHVKNGPVTLLVGHEYDISIDDADGKRGVLFKRKRSAEGDFAQHLSATLKQACETCRRIETDGDVGDQVAFRGNEVCVVLNDRLNAPNTEETLQAIQSDLDALLGKLYGDAKVSISRRDDAKARLVLDVQAEGNWAVDQLLANL